MPFSVGLLVLHLFVSPWYLPQALEKASLAPAVPALKAGALTSFSAKVPVLSSLSPSSVTYLHSLSASHPPTPPSPLLSSSQLLAAEKTQTERGAPAPPTNNRKLISLFRFIQASW
jgi:hypothetical protein